MQRHARYDVEQLKTTARCRRHMPDRGVCQVFWHDGDGFSESRSSSMPYELGRRVALETRFDCPSGIIHLRVDPGIQVGIVAVEHITVAGGGDGDPFCRHDSRDGWQGVTLGGTAVLIGLHARLLVESLGGGPPTAAETPRYRGRRAFTSCGNRHAVFSVSPDPRRDSKWSGYRRWCALPMMPGRKRGVCLTAAVFCGLLIWFVANGGWYVRPPLSSRAGSPGNLPTCPCRGTPEPVGTAMKRPFFVSIPERRHTPGMHAGSAFRPPDRRTGPR